MKKMLLFLLGTLLLPSVRAATITIGSPVAVSGSPGSTVTWNFTIENDTAYWVLLTLAEFPDGNPLGIFEDFTLTFPDVAPHTSPTGIARFTIDAGAAPGASVTGPINVYYSEYDVDLSTWTGDDPPVPVHPDLLTFANVTVTVDEVPEPATFLLVAGALLLLCAKRTRRS